MSVRKRLANFIDWINQNVVCPKHLVKKMGEAYEDIRLECVTCGKVTWRYSDTVPRDAHDFYVENRIFERVTSGEQDVPRYWEQENK